MIFSTAAIVPHVTKKHLCVLIRTLNYTSMIVCVLSECLFIFEVMWIDADGHVAYTDSLILAINHLVAIVTIKSRSKSLI